MQPLMDFVLLDRVLSMQLHQQLPDNTGFSPYVCNPEVPINHPPTVVGLGDGSHDPSKATCSKTGTLAV